MKSGTHAAIPILVAVAFASTTSALEKAPVPTDLIDRSGTWNPSAAAAVSYFNACTGWVWSWSVEEPGRFGVFFEIDDGAHALGTLSFYATEAAKLGYGFTGSIALYEADSAGCALGQPLATRPIVTTQGWNYIDWDILVPGRFTMITGFGSRSVSLASDHPAAGPTGPPALGMCYPTPRTGHSFNYFFSGDTISCPPVPLTDPAGEVEMLWSLRPRRSWFEDVTTPELAHDPSDWGYRYGSSWGDYDADGDPDLLLPGVFGGYSTNKLLRNDGTAGFVDIGPTVIPDWFFVSGVFGDYDNDGDLDLLLVSYHENILLRNDGIDSFVDVTPVSLTTAGGAQQAFGVSWADFDRDGHLDIYIKGNSHEYDRLYRNDGGTDFVDVTADVFPVVTDTRISRATSWADYDNDGDADLFTGYKLYRNEAGAGFQEVLDIETYPGVGAGAGIPHCAAWGDYDNDGDLDLYLTRRFMAFLYRNDGGQLLDVAELDLTDFWSVTGYLPRQGGWGDYDNDGYLDLYQANPATSNRLLRNVGDGTFADVTGGCLADQDQWDSAVNWADYDTDGRLDIYIERTEHTYLAHYPGGNVLLRNVHPVPARWLKVAVEGTVSNRQGVGTRVRVVAEDLSQVREVTADDGRGSQTTYPLHFGLGSRTRVDSLIVRWPAGGQQILTDLQVNRVVKVVEGEEAVEIPATGATADRPETALWPARPNPFRDMTEISFTLTTESEVRLAVFDVAGRRLRELVSGVLPPGDHSVTWDGREDSGRHPAAGIYLVRFEAGPYRQSQKVVLFRSP